MWKISIFLLCFFSFNLSAQQPSIQDFNFGSTGWDELHEMLLYSDETILLAGNTAGAGGSVGDVVYGQNDFWIQKMTLSGTVLWTKTFGGLGEDRLWKVLPLENGHLLLCGDSDSGQTGSKQTAGHGGLDYWVLLLDENGSLLWEKSFGSTGHDRLFDACLHPEGGFMLAGFSEGGAQGDKTSESKGGADLWLLHINEMGNLLAQTNYGGADFDNVYQIVPTIEGGFMLAGATKSPQGFDVSQPSFGDTDMWLLKLDAAGEKIWDKRFGGTGSEQAYVLKQLSDGNWLLGGGSASGKNAHKRSSNYGSYDFWALKIKENGDLIWENSFGGSALDVMYDVVEGADGSLYFGGVSDSPKSGTKQADLLGGYDFYQIKCTAKGEFLWDATYGGVENDALTQMLQMQNGAFLMAGHSNSPAGGTKQGTTFGENDIWFMQTLCAADLDLPENTTYCQGSTQIIEAFSTCVGSCAVLWNGVLGDLEHAFEVETPETIEAKLVDENGCQAEAAFAYDISPGLDINIGPTDTLVGQNQSLLLGTSAPPGSTWSWSTGSDNAFIRTKETGVYSVTVTTPDGCVGADTIEVCHCLKNKIYIPNVFSPSGDWFFGNDAWVLQGSDSEIKAIKNVQVFSRSGQLVFETKTMALNQAASGWTGKDKSGRLVEPGVYTYFVEITYENEEEETIFGTVSIIR